MHNKCFFSSVLNVVLNMYIGILYLHASICNQEEGDVLNLLVIRLSQPGMLVMCIATTSGTLHYKYYLWLMIYMPKKLLQAHS